jgi:NarL family two-component system sensor histidine kinase LiaS
MASFVILLVLALFITIGFTDMNWLEVLFERRLSRVPLIIYIAVFSGITALIVISYIRITEERRKKKVEDALKMLNKGQYSASIFLNMFSDETPVQISKSIDKEFLRLHEKMMLISEEAVSAQQVSAVSNEAREEILEKERHRIARELHDSVSQQLFAAAMLLSTVEAQENQLPESLQPQINLISNIIGDAQSEMRALLLHLRPIKLDGKSLKKGIEQLLDELKSKVPITIKHEIEDITLTEAIEDHLFRIVQELLSNVLRLSQADELEVYLKETENFYQLRFVDDGVGFDMNEKSSSGFGLRNIRERIEGLGGNVRIISFPEQGTSIEIRIPLITGG